MEGTVGQTSCRPALHSLVGCGDRFLLSLTIQAARLYPERNCRMRYSRGAAAGSGVKGAGGKGRADTGARDHCFRPGVPARRDGVSAGGLAGPTSG